MIAVTGAAGFIGSRLIKHLNDNGITDIIAVDDLSDGHKFKNLKGLDFAHYIDKDNFLLFLSRNAYYIDIENGEGIFAELLVSDIDVIIHLGAISDTTCWDGKKVMKENYEFSVKLLDHLCSLDISSRPKFIYASSASVYGNNQDGSPDPLNVYAFSKYMIDKYAIGKFAKFEKKAKKNENVKPLPQIVGLRFFNVYGSMNEWHKGNQSSPVYKFYHQMENGPIKLFDVDAKRDFVHVDDACSVIMFFLENDVSGIFDVGTGEPRSFNDVAAILLNLPVEVVRPNNVLREPYYELLDWQVKRSKFQFIEFPEGLRNHYQYMTKANLESLRAVGYNRPFMNLESGIEKFLDEAKK